MNASILDCSWIHNYIVCICCIFNSWHFTFFSSLSFHIINNRLPLPQNLKIGAVGPKNGACVNPKPKGPSAERIAVRVLSSPLLALLIGSESSVRCVWSEKLSVGRKIANQKLHSIHSRKTPKKAAFSLLNTSCCLPFKVRQVT